MAEPTPLDPAIGDHADCAESLRVGMHPVKITVSTEPPLVAGPYTTEPFVCPHGTVYWIEPTGEQIAEWVREGVK